MESTAVQLLLRDLREVLLHDGSPSSMAALRRMNLFEIMYLRDEDSTLPRGSKLILVADHRKVFVCDEYTNDGRCHVLDDKPFYAIFDRDEMALEFRKVVVPIKEIHYEAADWPEGITDKSLAGILAYFFGETT